MKPFTKPEEIRDTKIGVNTALVQDLDLLSGNSLFDSSKRRLDASKGQYVWYQGLLREDEVSLDVLDALQITLVSSELDSEEESTVLQSISWDLVKYDQDFIKIQLYFDNPEDIGGLETNDFIALTFWGIDFFID